MPRLLTSLRLPLLAILASVALTSCFDRDKKDDPKPKARCGTSTPAASSTN